MEAKEKGHTIKLRHSKVLICGSSAAGKTNFLNLLLRNDFVEEHKMTGVTDAKHKMVVRKIAIGKNSEGIYFKNLELEHQIQWLRSHLHHKANDTKVPVDGNDRLSSHQSSGNLAAQLPVKRTKSLKRCNSESALQSAQSPLSPIKPLPLSPEKLEEDVGENGMSSLTMQQSASVQQTEIEQKLTTMLNDHEIEQLPEVWDVLTFLDTGGQPEYISMLPAVNSAVMVTFVVLSLENGPSSLSRKITVYEGEENYSYDLTYDYSSLVKMLISMRKPKTHNHSVQVQGDTIGNDRSYLSFIGTKSDLLENTDETLQNIVLSIDKGLQKIVKEAECEADLLDISRPHNSPGCHLIPVSNRHANTSKEDNNALLIRNAIYKKLEERKVHDIPIEWLLLELEIKQWCRVNGSKSYMTIDEVYKLCKKCSINDDKEYIESFLRFYHMVGIFLYYNLPGIENPIVITNHQWLFDNLSKLVVFAIKAKHSTLDQHQRISLEKGLMCKKFMKEIKFDLISDYFIKLLEHLKIITPIDTEPEDYYFVPCILPTSPLDRDEKLALLNEYGGNHNAKPLLIQIANNSKSALANSYYGLPRGVFGFLIVHLLQLQNTDPKWRFLRMLFTNTEGNACIYHNLVTFQYFPVDNKKQAYYIILIDRFLYLEIQVRSKENPESNHTYVQIKDLVKYCFKKVCTKLNFDANNVCVAFACSICNKRHLARKNFDADSSEPFHCQKTNMVDWFVDSVWFSKVSGVYN